MPSVSETLLVVGFSSFVNDNNYLVGGNLKMLRYAFLSIQSPTTPVEKEASSASLPSTTSCERARLLCSIRDNSFASLRNLRRWVIFALCQRFFTAFSERPGRNWEISVHLFPIRRCSLKRIPSSLVVHGVLFKLGSKKLTYRSRTCSPIRPGSNSAMAAHFIPLDRISVMTSSSCCCHDPLTTPG